MQAITRVNAEQASKQSTWEADPPITRGRPLPVGEEASDRRPSSPTGVLATACRTRNPTGTREAQAVKGVIFNREPARDRVGRIG
jgi:hypothetical protein